MGFIVSVNQFTEKLPRYNLSVQLVAVVHILHTLEEKQRKMSEQQKCKTMILQVFVTSYLSNILSDLLSVFHTLCPQPTSISVVSVMCDCLQE